MTAGDARIISVSAHPGPMEHRSLRTELRTALQPDQPAVVLDFSARRGLNSEDLDLVLDSAARVMGRDVRFLVVAGSLSNRVLLEVSRIASVLPVFNSLTDALHGLEGTSQLSTQPLLVTDSVRPQERNHECKDERTYDSQRA